MDSSPNPSHFHYTDANNREEFAKMVCIEQLSFNFGEKVGFVNYCQKALNPASKRIPRTTNTTAQYVHKLFKKCKNDLAHYFANLNSKISICSDIWTDPWYYLSLNR